MLRRRPLLDRRPHLDQRPRLGLRLLAGPRRNRAPLLRTNRTRKKDNGTNLPFNQRGPRLAVGFVASVFRKLHARNLHFKPAILRVIVLANPIGEIDQAAFA